MNAKKANPDCQGQICQMTTMTPTAWTMTLTPQIPCTQPRALEMPRFLDKDTRTATVPGSHGRFGRVNVDGEINLKVQRPVFQNDSPHTTSRQRGALVRVTGAGNGINV